MTDCTHLATFLQAVSARSVTATIPETDLAELQQLGLVDVLSADERSQLEAEVAQLQAAQQAIADEQARQQQQADAVAADTRRTHSVLFHLQGVDKEEASVDRLNEEQAALQALEADLAKRQADFQQLLVKQAELDLVLPYDGRFIAITTAGRVALRDLNVALYRVGDEEFASYWTQAKAIDAELDGIASRSASLHASLAPALPEVDPTYLWAVAIGLAKQPTASAQSVPAFLNAYEAVGRYSRNDENRLMAAEVVSSVNQPLEGSVSQLGELLRAVDELGVPAEAATGVAAILLSGRRADGTYATESLRQFLLLTASYEAAALLAIVNQPHDDLARAFTNLRALFASWGYSVSEDTELSSAYLALSNLPAETVGTKMAILARGVGAYLEYPLVGAAVLASIPVLEANETLNLLEKAYEILGQRTGPMSQAELITLAIRLVHGVDVRSVNELDPTQTAPATYPNFSYATTPARMWIPVLVVHSNYFATYSAIGGVHPGHIHAVGAGGGGFVGGGFGG
ncbi:MAG TPA: hypothetical protein VEL82_06880 [Thermoplasmata archaeon]|nr:hypothetical protein [Thermoplasmata archaeon]